MNRRTLLGRFVLGSAAVLGAGMAVTKAEASERNMAEIDAERRSLHETA